MVRLVYVINFEKMSGTCVFSRQKWGFIPISSASSRLYCRKEIESKTDDLSNISCLLFVSSPLSQTGSSGVGSLFVSKLSLTRQQ